MLKNKSRYISKLLRHKPEELILDKNGYCSVKSLLYKLKMSKDDLDWIVEHNDKKRFSYNQDETLIRANQGHSKKLNIQIDMDEAGFIPTLYHGTATHNVESILKNGLKSMNRKHVHLSLDKNTAINVAKRHSKNITILNINSAQMRADNIKIYISDNNVYLTDYIEPKYIKICK